MNKNELLVTLYHYRERLTTEHGKPGWSQWALYGALAGLVWLGIDLMKSENVDFTQGIPLMLILFVASPLLRFIPEIKSNKKTQNSSKRVYLSLRQEIYESRYTTIFSGLSMLGVLVYTNFYVNIPTPFQTILNVYGAVVLFFLCVGIAFSRADIHTPDLNETNIALIRYVKNIGFVVVSVTAMSSVYGLSSLVNSWNNLSMWQAGLVLFGIYYVIRKIIEEFEGNPLLGSINNLIDEVTFDKMAPTEAEKQMRIIWLGAEFNDIIAPDVANFIRANDLYRSLIVKTEASCEEYLTSDVETSDEKGQAIVDSVNEVSKLEGELTDIIRRIRKKLINFHWLESGSEGYKEITEFLTKELQTSQEAEKRLKDFAVKLDEKEAELASQKNAEDRGRDSRGKKNTGNRKDKKS